YRVDHESHRRNCTVGPTHDSGSRCCWNKSGRARGLPCERRREVLRYVLTIHMCLEGAECEEQELSIASEGVRHGWCDGCIWCAYGKSLIETSGKHEPRISCACPKLPSRAPLCRANRQER